VNATAFWLGGLVLVALIATVSSCEAAAQPGPGTFLVAHARVFDGERIHEDTQVAVEAGIIRAVGSDLTAWRHLPVVDGTGATLIPGLIDAHAHVRIADDLKDALRFGVTTVLDLGLSGVTLRNLSDLRLLAASRMDIADVLSAGFAAPAPGGHGTEFRSAAAGDVPTVPSVEGADAFVAMRQSEGSDYLKIILNGVRTAEQGVPNLDEPRVKALVDAAHSRGMLAVAHVETVGDAEIALASGVDGLAHVWRRGGANADLARRLRANGVFVIATLAIPDGLLEGRAALLADARVQPFLSSREKAQLSRSYVPRTAGAGGDQRRANLDAHVAAVRSLQQVGVTLLVGTDASMVAPGVEATAPAVHGASVHRELELLLNAGLSPTEALSGATARTADAFRLGDRGRIMPGRKADMVLVRGDPTSDIRATRDILRVWRNGMQLDRAVGP
jgi:imidazolonepropionase-like amidohydrolase